MEQNITEHYIINNPIGRLGNHLITYLNTIYLHYLLKHKNITENNDIPFKITLNNCNDLLKKSIDYITPNYININENSHLLEIENKNILPGYNIFHIQEILNNKLSTRHKICLYDYFNIATIYLPKLWNIPIPKFTEFQNKFKSFIQTHNIILEKTLFIHIKCTDNTIPDKIIHKKYNIYPNIYYLDICNIYNFNTICICTDNPNHILIKNIEQKLEQHNITVVNISKITNDIMMDFYFLACAKNILVDNSTFTFMSSIHPSFINEYGFSKDKTIFLYKEFFNRFLLDIGTNKWDKNILDFCINNLDSFEHTVYSNYLIYNEITFSNCNKNNENNDKICDCIYKFKLDNSHNYNHKLILFDVNLNSKTSGKYKTNIKTGDWVGSEQQINMLLLD